jgi:hypothetical protein
MGQFNRETDNQRRITPVNDDGLDLQTTAPSLQDARRQVAKYRSRKSAVDQLLSERRPLPYQAGSFCSTFDQVNVVSVAFLKAKDHAPVRRDSHAPKAFQFALARDGYPWVRRSRKAASVSCA